MVRDAAAAGLAASGCNVIDIGIAMTPTVAVMTDAYARHEGEIQLPGAGTKDGDAVAGMVITASHNPQQWNGLKCLLAEGGEYGSAACAPPAQAAGEVIDLFKAELRAPTRGESWQGIGQTTPDRGASLVHIRRVMNALFDAGLGDVPGDDPDAMSEIGNGLNVAIDCCNASGIEGAPLFLEAMGVDEMLQLGVERDPVKGGIFGHPPEPTAENLSLSGGLCDAVRENQSDVGFAQDPDADRLAIIDENGTYIGEEYTLALSAMALLEGARAEEKRTGRPTTGDMVLVTNLSTSRMLDDVAAKYGAKVIRTPVGEAHVVAAMKQAAADGKHVVCGGEGNGGLIWPRVAYVRDSLSSMAMVLWLISPAGGGNGTKRRVSDLVASLPSYAIVKQKVDLANRDDAVAAGNALAAHYSVQNVDRRDGVWIDFTSGPRAGKAWLHVRASNTEPIMRLIAEAPTVADANALLAEAAAVIARK